MNFTRKDILGLSIIPLELILGNLLVKVPIIKDTPNLAMFTSVGVFTIGFVIMISLFKDYLHDQWLLYKKKIWLKLFINVVLTLGAVLLLHIARGVLTKNLSINDMEVSTYQSISLMLISSIQPFIAPFAEELTFRYLLFQKIPNGLLKLVMFFVSSVLFGLIHINNFNGDWIQTVPYMIIGGYLALICYSFKNIWGSIITHWMFNSVNSLLPALVLLIAKIFNLI